MHKNQTIRKVIAAALLLFFTFSITPKQWLHAIITNHKDTYTNAGGDKIILTTVGFHCNCDTLVVQSPFIYYDGPAEMNAPAFFILHQAATINNFISVYHFFSKLRGPPVSS